jgi:hypothetical protein
VRSELEADIFPSILKLFESLFHFGLLSGLIGDLFDIFLEFTKVKVVDVLQKKVVIDGELNSNLSFD